MKSIKDRERKGDRESMGNKKRGQIYFLMRVEI